MDGKIKISRLFTCKCKNIYKLAFMVVLYFSITNIKHYLYGCGYKTELVYLGFFWIILGLTFFSRIDLCRRKHRVDTETSITYCGM